MDRINTSRRAFWLAVFLGAATLAAFWRVLLNDFILYDDPYYVTDNLHVLGGLSWENIVWAFCTNDASNWHPITWLSHLLDVELFGLRPGWHHLSSLLLHIANTTLLFLLLKRLTGACWRSAMVAALFALHPLHVESVAWVAERKDVLSTFFLLLTLMAYVEYVAGSEKGAAAGEPAPRVRNPWLFYILALFCFALGLMSKPMLVTLPCLLLLLDYWPLRRIEAEAQAPTPTGPGAPVSLPAGPEGRRTAGKNAGVPPIRLLVEKVPFLLLAFASCIVTYAVQDRGHATTAVLPLAPRVANAIASYAKYLGKTVWPSHLSVFYPHPDTRYPVSHQWPVWVLAVTASLLLAISLYAVWRRKRHPWLATGWFWYLGTLVPVIGIIQVGGQAMADRYAYIPLIGIFIGIVWGACEMLGRLPWSRTALAAIGLLATGACLVVTQHQVKYWRNDFALFQHALEVTTANPIAEFHAGTALRLQGKAAEAVPHFNAVIEAAPALASGYYGLALCFQELGKLEEAVEMFQKALAAASWDARIHNDLGTLLWVLKRRPEAVAEYREALRLKPEFPEALVNLGVALSTEGDLAGATARFTEALRLRPDYGQALTRLAETMLKQGKLAEAEAYYRQWVHFYPENADARINLGGVLWRRGRIDEALAHYAEAVRVQPGLAIAHCNLATALSARGRLSEAAAEFAIAAKLKPNYLEAVTGLGRSLAGQGQFAQAQAPFQEAVRLCPTNVDLRLYLGSALIMAGKTNEATAAFAEVLRLDPEFVKRSVATGRAFAVQGQPDAAMARFHTALWVKPDDADAHEGLGQLLKQLGKAEEAETHLQEAIRLRQK